MENGTIQNNKMTATTFINLVVDYAVGINSDKGENELADMKAFIQNHLADQYHSAQQHIIDLEDLVAPLDVMVKTMYEVALEEYQRPVCLNCDAKLEDCACGNKEVFSRTHAVCIHCGYQHNCSKPVSTQSETMKCVECGEKFLADYNDVMGENFWLTFAQ